jgi:hypothetical protein
MPFACTEGCPVYACLAGNDACCCPCMQSFNGECCLWECRYIGNLAKKELRTIDEEEEGELGAHEAKSES